VEEDAAEERVDGCEHCEMGPGLWLPLLSVATMCLLLIHLSLSVTLSLTLSLPLCLCLLCHSMFSLCRRSLLSSYSLCVRSVTAYFQSPTTETPDDVSNPRGQLTDISTLDMSVSSWFSGLGRPCHVRVGPTVGRIRQPSRRARRLGDQLRRVLEGNSQATIDTPQAQPPRSPSLVYKSSGIRTLLPFHSHPTSARTLPPVSSHTRAHPHSEQTIYRHFPCQKWRRGSS
jgi:hypothetical protein